MLVVHTYVNIEKKMFNTPLPIKDLRHKGVMFISSLRGALTNRVAAFRSRPWELRRVYSIDLLDSLNSAVEFNVRGSDFLRVLPRITSLSTTGSEWISDRIRYSVDAFRLQRVDTPLVRFQKQALWQLSWKVLFKAVCAFKLTSVFSLFTRSQLTVFKAFATTYLNLFGNCGIPFGLSAYFWIDRLYDFFSNNKALLDTTYAFTTTNSKLALGARQFKALDNASGFQLNFEGYSSIYIVGSEVTQSHPVLWSAMSRASAVLGLKVYSFSDSQPTKFSKLVKGFKHLGPVSCFKRFVESRHWQTTTSPDAKGRVLILVVIRHNLEFPILNYAQSLLQKETRKYSLFPVFNTNEPIHNSLFGFDSKSLARSLTGERNSVRVLGSNTFSVAKGLEYSRSVEVKSKGLTSAFVLHTASHANNLVNLAKVTVPTAAFFETSEVVQSLLGEQQRSISALNAPGLSLPPTRFFLLFYTLQIKTLGLLLRDQFKTYLLSSVARWFLINKNRQSRIVFLNTVVLSLSLSSLLYSLEQNIMFNAAFARLYISFDTLMDQFPQIYCVPQNLTSELISEGYLKLPDYISAHSAALQEVCLKTLTAKTIT